MIYFTNCYAKLWNLDSTGNYPRARISTSEKDQQGNYKNSSWFATFLGDAKQKTEMLNGNERIKILKGKVSNIGKKMEDGSYRNYLNVAIFDFELVVNRNSSDGWSDSSEPNDEIPF